MKEVLEAVNARIKAPYFGYTVLAFFACNWRGVFLLVMTAGTPEERLSAFDTHTSIVSLFIAPLVVGIVVAASTEWLRFCFEWVARKPRQWMSMRDLDEEHQKTVRKMALEALRDKRDAREEETLIERAKREDKAVQDIENEEVKRRLQAELERRRAEKDTVLEVMRSLSGEANDMLRAAAQHGDGNIRKIEYLSGAQIQIAQFSYGAGSPRDLARYDAALKALLKNELLDQQGAEGHFQLTALGWEIAEKLP